MSDNKPLYKPFKSKEAEYKQLIVSNPQGFNVKNTINILGFKIILFRLNHQQQK